MSVRDLLPWRRGPSRFQRASDGSMSLIEHLLELRSRLFKASLAIAVGMVIGYLLSQRVYELLESPYCSLNLPEWEGTCPGLQQLEALTAFMLRLKIALWIGLILAAPVWFYQLWAFVAPGLHRHERKWAYIFVSLAVPLFVAGALLAYLVVDRGLKFLFTQGIEGLNIELEVSGYISFVTTVMLVFAVGFELPLLILMLNFAGIVSARRLLSWWRVAVFVCFVFAAFATPDPGPFGMLLLAGILSAMYFIAVGVAFLNDRRRAKRRDPLDDLPDDEISALAEELEPVTAGESIDAAYDDVGSDDRAERSARPGSAGRYDDLI
jgi:sec-independent protein translocase protein TatC